jgi:hypothetical protein
LTRWKYSTPFARALKVVGVASPEQRSVRTIPQEELELPPVRVGDAEVPGRPTGVPTCELADQPTGRRVEASETAPVLLLQAPPVLRPFDVVVPAAGAALVAERRAVLPQGFESGRLFRVRIGQAGEAESSYWSTLEFSPPPVRFADPDSTIPARALRATYNLGRKAASPSTEEAAAQRTSTPALSSRSMASASVRPNPSPTTARLCRGARG